MLALQLRRYVSASASTVVCTDVIVAIGFAAVEEPSTLSVPVVLTVVASSAAGFVLPKFCLVLLVLEEEEDDSILKKGPAGIGKDVGIYNYHLLHNFVYLHIQNIFHWGV